VSTENQRERPTPHPLDPPSSPRPARPFEASGFPLPRTTLDSTAATVPRQGSDFGSSMSRAAMAGLPTEVEHILGDFTARARAHGVATPLLDLATLQLRVDERRLSSAVR